MKPECAKFDFGKCDETGAVPDFVDFTTDEYSFVIKCPASRHLPVRRKTPPPCRGGGSKSRRGFPPTCHSARETKRHYGRRKGNKTALWPPHGEQKGRYAPVGVRPPPPLRGSSPCEAGQFFPSRQGRGFPNPQARKGLHATGTGPCKNVENFFRIENPDTQSRGATSSTRQTAPFCNG